MTKLLNLHPYVFWFGLGWFFLPFGSYMTVMKVLITTCYLVMKSHGVNRLMESNLFNFTVWDDIGRKKHFSLRRVHFQKLHNVAVSRGRPGGRPGQMGQSTSHSCGVWSGSWAVSFCGCHLHTFFCSLSLVDLSLFPKYMWARAHGGPLPGCSLGCNGIFMAVSTAPSGSPPFREPGSSQLPKPAT